MKAASVGNGFCSPCIDWRKTQSAANVNEAADVQKSGSASNIETDKIDISEQYRIFQEKYKPTFMPTDEQFAAGFFNFDREYVNAKDYWNEKGLDGILEKIEGGGDGSKTAERAVALLKELLPAKEELTSKIRAVLKNNGLRDVDVKKLKIEIGANGKIMVGGLSDGKKLRQIQDALNRESGLAGQIKDYQNKEKVLKADLGNMGIMKWDASKNGVGYIEELVRNGGFDENGDTDAIFNDPLYYAVAELFSGDGPDFSSTSKGVADPVGTINKVLSSAKRRIEDLFAGENNRAELAAQQNGQPTDKIDRMSFDNMKIKISSDGQISFEGRFAQSDSKNSTAEAWARQVIQDMLSQDNEDSDSFNTAMLSLKMQHDDTFGESATKQAEAVVGKDGVKAYIIDPVETANAKDDIRNAAADFLTAESGVVFGKGDLEVDDNGKIILRKTPAGVSKQYANELLAQLNEVATKYDSSKIENDTPIGNAAGQVAKARDKLKSYGPDGDPAYLYSAHDPEQIEKEERETLQRLSEFKREFKRQYVYSDPLKEKPDKYRGRIFDTNTRSADSFGSNSQGYFLLQANSETEKRYQAWLDGNGQFEEIFKQRTDENGYGYWSASDKNAGTWDCAGIISINNESYVKIDYTGLTASGFTEGDRSDFLGIVQNIINELGYDIKAQYVGYQIRPSESNPNLSQLKVGMQDYEYYSSSSSTTFGMHDNHKYTQEQYDEFSWRLEQALNKQDTDLVKEYMKKMRAAFDSREPFY